MEENDTDPYLQHLVEEYLLGHGESDKYDIIDGLPAHIEFVGTGIDPNRLAYIPNSHLSASQLQCLQSCIVKRRRNALLWVVTLVARLSTGIFDRKFIS